MAVSSDYLDFVLEQLAPVGPLTSRKMFGGVGLYAQGLFFALIDDDTLYLKGDDACGGVRSRRQLQFAFGMSPDGLLVRAGRGAGRSGHPDGGVVAEVDRGGGARGRRGRGNSAARKKR
jgi:hypothetical protein